MSPWIDFARVVVVANLALLAVLGGVWIRNYRRLRSRQTLGMVVFAALLFVENAFALYVYSLDPVLEAWFSNQVPDPAWQAMLLFHAIETLALGFFAWVTLD
jgi:hypothetical protein